LRELPGANDRDNGDVPVAKPSQSRLCKRPPESGQTKVNAGSFFMELRRDGEP